MTQQWIVSVTTWSYSMYVYIVYADTQKMAENWAESVCMMEPGYDRDHGEANEFKALRIECMGTYNESMPEPMGHLFDYYME